MGIIYTCITCDKTVIHGWDGYQCEPCKARHLACPTDHSFLVEKEVCKHCGFIGYNLHKKKETKRKEGWYVLSHGKVYSKYLPNSFFLLGYYKKGEWYDHSNCSADNKMTGAVNNTLMIWGRLQSDEYL